MSKLFNEEKRAFPGVNQYLVQAFVPVLHSSGETRYILVKSEAGVASLHASETPEAVASRWREEWPGCRVRLTLTSW